MDESKEYILMCKKLPKQIVKDFEENISSINNVGSVCMLDNGVVGYIGTHAPGWQTHGYECSSEDTPIIRLYTQEQLQKLIISKYRDKYNYAKYTDMELILEMFSLVNIEPYGSFEQFYLHEFVSNIYELRWDYYKKEWCKI